MCFTLQNDNIYIYICCYVCWLNFVSSFFFIFLLDSHISLINIQIHHTYMNICVDVDVDMG